MNTNWMVAGAIAGTIMMPVTGLAQAARPAAPQPQAERPQASGTVADVDFVKLPTLREHLQMARALQGKLGGSTAKQ